MRFLPRRRLPRALIYLVCFLLVLLALDLVWVEFRRTVHPGYETTRIDQPLKEDGSVDYLAAIDERFGEGVKPADNAAPVLLQAFGRNALPKNQPPDGITEKLDMPHLPEVGDDFIIKTHFQEAHPELVTVPDVDPISATPAAPWPPVLSALTRAWVTANEKPLAKVEEASRRPRFWMPLNGGNHPETLAAILLPYLSPLKESGAALLDRAAVRLESGDVDGFHADVMTVHRLARLVGQGATLIDRLVGVALESGACRLERAGAGSGKLPPDRARAMAAELAAMPDLQDYADTLDVAERFMLLDLMQTCSRIGPKRAGELLNAVAGPDMAPVWVYRLIPVDYERAMKIGNHWYDGYLTALRQPTYARRARAMQLCERDFKRLHETGPVAGMFNGDWPVALLVPAIFNAERRWEFGRMQNRLTQVALALESYRAAHGTYPRTLAELAPKDLAVVPEDFYGAKPLVYQPRNERPGGGYTLYSVGPNMTDDGGKHTAPADDIDASKP